MIKKLLNGKSQTIASAAVIVASFSIISRFIGFIRDRILAGTFGASDTLDVYFAAFRVPDFLFQLVIVGALSASFIPIFTKYYKNKTELAWRFTSNTLNLIALIFGFVIIVAMLGADYLAPLIAPGFDPNKQALVADMARVMFGAQFLLALSMVFGSALQGAKRFVLYSLAPILYNLGIIIGVVFFVPYFGSIGLAWGVVFGAFLHLVLQIIGIVALGYSWKLVFEWKSKDMRFMIKHMIPRVMGLAVTQVNFIAMTIIASTLAVGSVTILQFAYNLNFFSVGVIAVSYAIAAFPTLCELANGNRDRDFVKAFSLTIRQMMLFFIPATVLFLLLRAQIVRVVLGAGAFDWEATVLTADTLAFFVISLFAQSIVYLLIRAYFAKNDTWTPFIVGIIAAGINIGLAIWLSTTLGVVAFGIAYSVAAMVQMILLWIFLTKKIGGLDEVHILKSLIHLSFAGIACAGTTQIIKYMVVEIITLDTFFAVLAQGMIAGLSGLLMYMIIGILLKNEEMIDFISGMKRRFFKRVKTTDTIVTELDT